jgi:hypothetical protein
MLVPRSKHRLGYKTSLLMLYSEIIAARFDVHKGKAIPLQALTDP